MRSHRGMFGWPQRTLSAAVPECLSRRRYGLMHGSPVASSVRSAVPVWSRAGARGADAWLSAAVAFYAAAWQLLILPFVGLLVVRGLTSAEPAPWWLFSPSIASGIAGAWCARSHHLRDDAFRWWGPWTLLVPAGPGLAYALGNGRAVPVGGGPKRY